ncbi:hypothetical protein C6503_02460 [Candidatus Poribacteria bacterium]|nr:MAG: hypothetical protein C6503_02460 [Candidatus Poribacteria bacterium]
MNSEKLGNALAKSKDIAINLLGNIVYRTRVEPIRDEDGIKGLKARWIGDPGENAIEINTPSGSADITIDTDTVPTIEYVQDGERRTVAVKHIKNLSCELDQEIVDRIATPRGAAIAMCIGAGAGLFGWFLISAARALSVQRVQQIDATISPIVSRAANTASEEDIPEANEDHGS